MSALLRRKALLATAKRLADELRKFRTPGSGDPIAPSRLEEVTRFLAKVRDLGELRQFLELLPSSFHKDASASAAPQLQEVAARVKPLIMQIPNADELVYVLRWAGRLLKTAGRGAASEDARIAPGGRRERPRR